MAAEPARERIKRGAWTKRLRETRDAYSVGVHDSGEDILDTLRGDRT
jgi:hypothetical protein